MTTCTACSSKNGRSHEDDKGVVTCRSCGGVYTSRPIYLGESYAYVLPRWSGRSDMDGAKYFDLTTLGSEGIKRSHGWFDPDTKLILQTG